MWLNYMSVSLCVIKKFASHGRDWIQLSYSHVTFHLYKFNAGLFGFLSNYFYLKDGRGNSFPQKKKF